MAFSIRSSPGYNKFISGLKALRQQSDVAMQAGYGQTTPETTPTQFQQTMLEQLRQRTAPATEALAKESGAMVERAGQVWSDFYGKPLEYDPQAALSLASAKHAQLMGAFTEQQQMEGTRQTTLKEVAALAGAAYNEFLEKKNQEKQLAIARDTLELEKKKFAFLTDKDKETGETKKEMDERLRVEDSIVSSAERTEEEITKFGLEEAEADAFRHKKFLLILSFIRASNLSKEAKQKKIKMAQDYFGKTAKWSMKKPKKKPRKSTLEYGMKHGWSSLLTRPMHPSGKIPPPGYVYDKNGELVKLEGFGGYGGW